MSLNLTANPASDAQWRMLLGQAEAVTGHILDQDTEEYLVQLLVRVASRQDLLDGLLALDRLTTGQPAGKSRLSYLQDIGDQCLLFAGLFPQYAAERMVRLSYFVSLGRTVYQQIHELIPDGCDAPYARLSARFVPLIELLHTMRELGDDGVRLTPLHAFDLWNDTGSDRALRFIRSFTTATPVHLPPGDTRYLM